MVKAEEFLQGVTQRQQEREKRFSQREVSHDDTDNSWRRVRENEEAEMRKLRDAMDLTAAQAAHLQNRFTNEKAAITVSDSSSSIENQQMMLPSAGFSMIREVSELDVSTWELGKFEEQILEPPRVTICYGAPKESFTEAQQKEDVDAIKVYRLLVEN